MGFATCEGPEAVASARVRASLTYSNVGAVVDVSLG
jgi:hypothetical protein